MSKSVLQDIPIGDTHGFESVSGDRPYNSLLFTQMHAALGLGGFAPNIAGQLDPTTSGSSKTVTIKTGAAFIIGHFFELKNDVNITISDAPANQHRWDIIAVRVDRNSAERKIKLVKITGTPSSENNTNNIPWSQLTNQDLQLSTGIWEFPIAVVHKHGNAYLHQDDLIKTLPSTNILEPFPVFEQVSLGNSSQTGYRVMIPNPLLLNTRDFSSESIVRCKFPNAIDGTKEATVVINNFDGALTVIPLKDVFGNKVKAAQLNNKIVELRVKPDASEGIVQFLLTTFASDIIDKTSFDLDGKTAQEILDEFYTSNVKLGDKFLLTPTNITSSNSGDDLTNINYRTQFQTPLPSYSKGGYWIAEVVQKYDQTSTGGTKKIELLIKTSYITASHEFFISAWSGSPQSTHIFEAGEEFSINQQRITKHIADRRYKIEHP